MPKNIDIDPNKIFAKDFLKSTELPIHQYQKSIDDELKIHGKENLKELLRHMYIVREFENMLNSFKTTGSYKNINYTYNFVGYSELLDKHLEKSLNTKIYSELKSEDLNNLLEF